MTAMLPVEVVAKPAPKPKPKAETPTEQEDEDSEKVIKVKVRKKDFTEVEIFRIANRLKQLCRPCCSPREHLRRNKPSLGGLGRIDGHRHRSGAPAVRAVMLESRRSHRGLARSVSGYRVEVLPCGKISVEICR
jgi:hypothetical protein